MAKTTKKATMPFAVTIGIGRPLNLLIVFALIIDASLIGRMSAPKKPTAETDQSRNIASRLRELLLTTNAPDVTFDDWGLEKNRKAPLPSYYPSQIPSQSSSPFANPLDRPSVQFTGRLHLLLLPSRRRRRRHLLPTLLCDQQCRR